MSKIITINRQFGSGGRELGKRLAEALGFAYYDNEIITEIANKSGLAESYVNSIVEKRPLVYYPITIGRSFPGYSMQPMELNTKVLADQHAIIKDLAQKRDCVIIGRCADYILKDQHPFKIFVYADMDSRVERCRNKGPAEENFSNKQLIRHIKEIDKERASYYKYFTDQKWDDMSHYSLCINTSDQSLKDWIPGLISLFKTFC